MTANIFLSYRVKKLFHITASAGIVFGKMNRICISILEEKMNNINFEKSKQILLVIAINCY